MYHQRECLLADIDADGQVVLTPYGEIVLEEWVRTPLVRPYVDLDTFVIMPNHFHAILVISVGATRRVALNEPSPSGPQPHSLGAMVGAFKSITAKRVNAQRDTPGAPLWQRNYYDVIIRSQTMLDSYRQ